MAPAKIPTAAAVAGWGHHRPHCPHCWGWVLNSTPSTSATGSSVNWVHPPWLSGFPGGTSDKKKIACQCRRHKKHKFDPWVGKIPWSRKWQPTPLFLPRKFHGQRSPVGYSPWGVVGHYWACVRAQESLGQHMIVLPYSSLPFPPLLHKYKMNICQRLI